VHSKIPTGSGVDLTTWEMVGERREGRGRGEGERGGEKGEGMMKRAGRHAEINDTLWGCGQWVYARIYEEIE